MKKMNIKIGYLYRSRNNIIYQVLCKYYSRYRAININKISLGYYYFKLTGMYYNNPSSFDLIEEIGKIEDYPEYFL